MSIEIRPARDDELDRVHFVVAYSFSADRILASDYPPYGPDFF
jgi:hypothetical protein